MPWRNLKRFFYKFLKQPAYAFGVVLKRATAYLAYKLGNGKSSYPEAITLFLTHRCNLKCKMCGQWGDGGVTKQMAVSGIKEELSLKELQNFVDDVSLFKPNITLFGGEPLLNPHGLDIIRYIKNKKMHCLMITNGSLLKDTAKGVVESNLDELNISIDGGRNLHDEIRGSPGLFEKIMDGIGMINQYKNEKRSKKPYLNLQCTISKYNYQHLDELLEVAAKTQANSLTFHNLIFLDISQIEKQKNFDLQLGCSSRDWQGFVFSPEIDPDILFAKMQQITAKKHDFSVDFYPNFSLKELKKYYNNPNYLSSEYSLRCLSPWVVAYVFPDGEISPCLNFSYAFGNIKEEKFSVLWNNQKAIRFRKILKENKIFPVCVRCSELYRY